MMDDLMIEFAAELRESFGELAPVLATWREQPRQTDTYEAIFRHLHTAKAGAGFVRMTRIEALAAAAEQALSDLRHWALDDNTRYIGLIIAALRRINAIAEAIELGIGFPTLGEEDLVAELLGQPKNPEVDAMPFDATQIRSVRLSLATLDDLLAKSAALNSFLIDLGDTPLPGALARTRNEMFAHVSAIRALRYAPATQLYLGLAAYVDQLAVTHDRDAELVVDEGQVWLDRAHIPVLRNVLCHLIRNAIAHGIEPRGLRVQRGKAALGQISLTTKATDDGLTITLTDDGGGIDYEALVALADAQHSSGDALAQIGRAGVTTAHNVSDIAGRGVGLDSARIALERLDATLELFDRPGQGFTAQMTLPLPNRSGHG